MKNFIEHFYYNQNIWFNSKPKDDKYIQDNYTNYFYKIIEENEFNTDKEYVNKILYIITLDQLPYYIFRNNYEHPYFKLSHSKSIKCLINYFFTTNISNIDYFIENYENIPNKDDYYILPRVELLNILLTKVSSLDFYKTFMLLPLRHTKCPYFVKIAFVLSKLLLKHKQDNTHYKRFYKASLLQYELINNAQSVSSIIQNKNLKHKQYCELYNTDIFSILDIENSKVSKWDDKIFTEFFKKYKLGIDKEFSNLELLTKFKSIAKKINIQLSKLNHDVVNDSRLNLVLSISGGVDSLTLYILLKYYGYTVHTVFINYGNRSSSNLEETFIKYFLDNLKSPNEYNFYKRITGIKRTDNNKHLRSIYEDVTRTIRFNMYSQVLKKVNAEYVVLGHNKDDTLENIFTNIAKCQKYENLQGMGFLGEEQGIKIMRPMLDIYKSDIYTFANTLGMPYLEDSTPKWSMRGRMRDILIPQLQEFDNRIVDGLIPLSKHLMTTNKYMEKYANTLISNLISYDKFIQDKEQYKYVNICDISTSIKNDTTLDELVSILTIILSKVCNSLKLPYISKKSINNMSSILLQSRINPNNKYTLNNNFVYYLDLEKDRNNFVIRYKC